MTLSAQQGVILEEVYPPRWNFTLGFWAPPGILPRGKFLGQGILASRFYSGQASHRRYPVTPGGQRWRGSPAFNIDANDTNDDDDDYAETMELEYDDPECADCCAMAGLGHEA